MKTTATQIAVMVGAGTVFALIAATPSSAQIRMESEAGYTSPYCMSIQGIPDELKGYCNREHERWLQLEGNDTPLKSSRPRSNGTFNSE
jgi:hypothetical protein